MSRTEADFNKVQTNVSTTAIDRPNQTIKAWPIWLMFGWLDIQKRYTRSVLGPWWLTIGIGFVVAVLGTLWQQLFNIDPAVYIPHLAAGFVVWELLQGLARIPQMDYQFDDLLGRFCYKNQCNTIIATGQTRSSTLAHRASYRPRSPAVTDSQRAPCPSPPAPCLSRAALD